MALRQSSPPLYNVSLVAEVFAHKVIKGALARQGFSYQSDVTLSDYFDEYNEYTSTWDDYVFRAKLLTIYDIEDLLNRKMKSNYSGSEHETMRIITALIKDFDIVDLVPASFLYVCCIASHFVVSERMRGHWNSALAAASALANLLVNQLRRNNWRVFSNLEESYNELSKFVRKNRVY